MEGGDSVSALGSREGTPESDDIFHKIYKQPNKKLRRTGEQDEKVPWDLGNGLRKVMISSCTIMVTCSSFSSDNKPEFSISMGM